MLGLIFGETQFPKEILKKIKKLKLNYFIIDLSTNRIFNKEKNVNYVSLGQFGKIIEIIKSYKKKKFSKINNVLCSGNYSLFSNLKDARNKIMYVHSLPKIIFDPDIFYKNSFKNLIFILICRGCNRP